MNKKILGFIITTLFALVFTVFSFASDGDVAFSGNFSEDVSFEVVTLKDGEKPEYLLRITGEGSFRAIRRDGENMSYDKKDESVLAEYAENIVRAEVGEGITEIGNYGLAFMKNLETVIIPESLEMIGSAAFESDTRLKNILRAGGEIKNGADLSNITKLGDYVFVSCASLEKISFSKDLVGALGKRVFDGCRSLEYLYLPDGVKSLGGEFIRNCDSLRYIYLSSDPRTEEATFEGAPSSFYICAPKDSLIAKLAEEKHIYAGENVSDVPFLPDADAADGGICGDRLYWQIKKAANFNADDPRYDLFIYGEGNKTQQKDIYGRNVNYNSSVTRGYGKYHDSIVSAHVGESVTELGGYAFARMSALTEVTLPAGISVIGNAAFEGDGKLESIHCEGEKKTVGFFDLSRVRTIGAYAFDACAKMTSVALPENAENGEILRETFKNCGLTSVVIPAYVTKIEEKAFSGCGSLSEIIFKGDPSIAENAFDKCPSITTVTGFAGGDAEELAAKYGAGFVRPCAITIRRASDLRVIDKAEVIRGESLTDFCFGGRIYLPYTDPECKTPYSGEQITDTTTLYVKELFALTALHAENAKLRALFRLSEETKRGNDAYEVVEVGALASRDRAGSRVPLTLGMNKTERIVFVLGGETKSAFSSIPLGKSERFSATAVGFDEDGTLSAEKCSEPIYFRGYVTLVSKATGEKFTVYTDMNVTSYAELAADAPKTDRTPSDKKALLSDMESAANGDENGGGKLSCLNVRFENGKGFSDALESYYEANGNTPDTVRIDFSNVKNAGLDNEDDLMTLAQSVRFYAEAGGRMIFVFRPTNPCEPSAGTGGRIDFRNASHIMNPQTPQGKLYLSAVGDGAKFIQYLKNLGVSVILEFAPEISGRYWWCAVDGGEDATESEELSKQFYISLWRYTRAYIENDCSLDSIVWLYRGGENGEEYYPGADYADFYGETFIG